MRFEIPFNEATFHAQLKLSFDLAWKENFKKNRKGLFFGIASLIFTIFLFLSNEKTAFILLGLTTFYAINYINYYTYYKKRKRIYYSYVDEEVQNQLAFNSPSIWEFNEQNFSYRDYKYEISIKWLGIKGIREIDKNLFIDLDNEKNMSYILGENEIGKENFERVLEFLNKKVKSE